MFSSFLLYFVSQAGNVEYRDEKSHTSLLHCAYVGDYCIIDDYDIVVYVKCGSASASTSRYNINGDWLTEFGRFSIPWCLGDDPYMVISSAKDLIFWNEHAVYVIPFQNIAKVNEIQPFRNAPKFCTEESILIADVCLIEKDDVFMAAFYRCGRVFLLSRQLETIRTIDLQLPDMGSFLCVFKSAFFFEHDRILAADSSQPSIARFGERGKCEDVYTSEHFESIEFVTSIGQDFCVVGGRHTSYDKKNPDSPSVYVAVLHVASFSLCYEYHLTRRQVNVFHEEIDCDFQVVVLSASPKSVRAMIRVGTNCRVIEI